MIINTLALPRAATYHRQRSMVEVGVRCEGDARVTLRSGLKKTRGKGKKGLLAAQVEARQARQAR